MSDLKPPSQNSPGAAPVARRTAIGRAAGTGSHVKEFQATIVHPEPQSPAGLRLAADSRVSPQAAAERKQAVLSTAQQTVDHRWID